MAPPGHFRRVGRGETMTDELDERERLISLQKLELPSWSSSEPNFDQRVCLHII